VFGGLIMKKMPERILIANLPTKIEELTRFSAKIDGPTLYMKRDDQTGSELSGNKIRKLEYSINEAISMGADTLITCGGLQSNHCRATAAAAAKLGLKSCLVLRTNEEESPDGNLFLDLLLGAEIKYVSAAEYTNSRNQIMQDINKKLKLQGEKGYIIPEGASNGIGLFGYYNAMEEILGQEKEFNIKFDAIVVAVGSGGTYAGLFYGNKINTNSARIVGFNVCNDNQYFKNAISDILHQSFSYTDNKIDFTKDEIEIIDGYVGDGYAISRPIELEFIHEVAKTEGIILDPVYTGKAMFGLVNEIKKGLFEDCKNILFIHTGGLFGLFPKKNQFNFLYD
jgi:D-cysteine desulfhydrase